MWKSCYNFNVGEVEPDGSLRICISKPTLLCELQVNEVDDILLL